MTQHDAILVVSFGGPEKADEVLPFLEHVVKGRGVPKERLTAVAEHYYALGGRSPINDQNRALIAALEEELSENPLSIEKLPIYFGNRHSAPFLEDTMREMADAGVKNAVAIVTSAFSSYSGCRQYREAVAVAQENVEGAPNITFIRRFFNHPGFLDAFADRVQSAIGEIGGEPRIAFTAHSIPVSMAESSDYEKQLMEACELVAAKVGVSQWQLVYQSRSGPPTVPWLEPDILDHIEALSLIGTERVVIAPIGFISDHMEVVWDLDHEAKEACEEHGIEMARALTVGTHPNFVSGLRELIGEVIGDVTDKRSLGVLGPRVSPCAADCCPRPARRPRPPTPANGVTR
ncbi:MAG: ferrochelatase [Polyangiales bacterium]